MKYQKEKLRKILFTTASKWQSTPALLPGKSHGWRSLIGYSPWGRKESDTTERLHFTSRRQKIWSPKTIRCWWKTEETQTDGKLYHILGLEESVLSKDYITQESLQIQCQWHFSQHQNKKFFNLYGNTKTLNSQSNLEKEKWSWRNQTPWLQATLQSYSN